MVLVVITLVLVGVLEGQLFMLIIMLLLIIKTAQSKVAAEAAAVVEVISVTEVGGIPMTMLKAEAAEAELLMVVVEL